VYKELLRRTRNLQWNRSIERENRIREFSSHCEFDGEVIRRPEERRRRKRGKLTEGVRRKHCEVW